jgi:hypothetical protein
MNRRVCVCVYVCVCRSSGDSAPSFAPDGRWKGAHSGSSFGFEVISDKYDAVQVGDSMWWFERSQ